MHPPDCPDLTTTGERGPPRFLGARKWVAPPRPQVNGCLLPRTTAVILTYVDLYL